MLAILALASSYRYSVPYVASDQHEVPAVVEAEPQSPPVTQEAAYPNTLSYEQLDQVLAQAGWPQWLHAQAIAVAYCESGYGRYKTNGVMLGLFQLSDAQAGWQGWWRYFGFDSSRYSEPVYNAQLALLIVYYDIDRGQSPFSQWECRG